VNLDGCTRCQLLWFDPGELPASGSESAQTLSPAASQAVALAELEAEWETQRISAEIEQVRSAIILLLTLPRVAL
jgi:hypothetical protein